MYFATVETATSMPSIASSLRMRGAPQVTFASAILRIRPTTSRSSPGRPTRPGRLLRLQKRLNPSRCQRITVAGWMKVVPRTSGGYTGRAETMVTEMVNLLVNAEVDATSGARYRERADESICYRPADPERWHGTYFPVWLLEPRRRAEKPLTAVVAEAYLQGVSTRRVEYLHERAKLQFALATAR